MDQAQADADSGAGSRSRSHSPSDADGCCSGDRLSDDEVARDLQTLTAVASETRYETLRLIGDADDEVCVCELEPALGVSQGAVSQALSQLFAAGLVSRRKDGRWRYYGTTPSAETLLAALDEIKEPTDD